MLLCVHDDPCGRVEHLSLDEDVDLSRRLRESPRNCGVPGYRGTRVTAAELLEDLLFILLPVHGHKMCLTLFRRTTTPFVQLLIRLAL